MTQNQQKQHPKNVKQPETTQHFKIGNPNFLLALVFQTSSPNSWIWVFWASKYQISNLLTNFKIDIVFGKLGAQIAAKKHKLSNLGQILPVSYFESTDFKCDIGFWKFWAPIPKYGHFGSKNINFLILTKFCLYPISKVLISNLAFIFKDFEPNSLNLRTLDQKVLTFQF